MNVNEINAYLQQAQEIIGERSPSEIDYDNLVVAHLRGMDIKRAIRAASGRSLEAVTGPMARCGVPLRVHKGTQSNP
jgi:hypothetical protein